CLAGAPQWGWRAPDGEEIVGEQCRLRAELRGLIPRARRCRTHRFDPLSRSGKRARAIGCGTVGRSGAAGQRIRTDDVGRLRSSSELRLTEDGAGFKTMLEIALPPFNLGTAAVALGLCRAAVVGTAAHLKSARFEHLGQSLGESLLTLRAQLATIQIDTDG